jgi:hypothetical protein
MPPLTTRYVLLSLVSGAAWGLIGYVLASAAFRSAIWGAVLVSPAIGVVVGLSFRWIHGLSPTGRVFASLVSLYVAATLFGLALGFSDLARGSSRRFPVEVVLHAVPAVLWGLTFTGYFLILWPLAYLNHRLLAREL